MSIPAPVAAASPPAVMTPLEMHQTKSIEGRFEKIEQIGEGTYGYIDIMVHFFAEALPPGRYLAPET